MSVNHNEESSMANQNGIADGQGDSSSIGDRRRMERRANQPHIAMSTTEYLAEGRAFLDAMKAYRESCPDRFPSYAEILATVRNLGYQAPPEDRQYTESEREFLEAIEAYKQKSGCKYQSWTEVLEMIREPGHAKPDEVQSGTEPKTHRPLAKLSLRALSGALLMEIEPGCPLISWGQSSYGGCMRSGQGLAYSA